MNDHITFYVLINTAQVCRNGMVQHLEHLLFYGANMNARNASGNTPLHVCAVNNQVFNQLHHSQIHKMTNTSVVRLMVVLVVLEKDPRGSKVLERCDIVSTSEIKAGKEQLDHEVIIIK